MPDISFNENISDAADQVAALLGRGLSTDQGIHIGTWLSAAGQLAGTSLFRSFHLALQDVEPGTAVLSEQANQETSTLIGLLLAILNENGIGVKDRDIVTDTPHAYLPRIDLLQVQEQFLNPFSEIMSKSNLSDLEAAYTATIACAIIIKGSSRELDPRISCGIAAFGIVEGAKAAPIPLEASDGSL